MTHLLHTPHLILPYSRLGRRRGFTAPIGRLAAPNKKSVLCFAKRSAARQLCRSDGVRQ